MDDQNSAIENVRRRSASHFLVRNFHRPRVAQMEWNLKPLLLMCLLTKEENDSH
jgi:hypothetical protein